MVGADGIFSKTRATLFPDAPQPQFTGQGCWRIVADRPPEVDRAEMYLGGPVKLGFNPVSRDKMYCLHPRARAGQPVVRAEEQLVRTSRELLAPLRRLRCGGARQPRRTDRWSITGRSNGCCCRRRGTRAASC